MKIVKLIPGSDEWNEYRLKQRNASEAPVIMGASSKTKRSELVKLRALGLVKEYSRWVTDVLFASGHAAEAAIRPYIAESVFNSDLYPIIGQSDDGELSASFDGHDTFGSGDSWECKVWNEAKASAVLEGVVPDEDFWQVVQQACVNDTGRVYYTVTDGTPEKTVGVWYELQEDHKQQLIYGWQQFDDDVGNYQHVEEDQPAVAGVVTSLPAVSVEVSGEIAVVSNLEKFGVALSDFVDNQLIKDPETDQDFADLEAQIKTLKQAEKALDDEEQRALSQIQAVSDMREMKGMYNKLARDNRLLAEKLVKSKKESIRAKIIEQAKADYLAHLSSIDETLGGKVKIPVAMPDFAGAIKGKKTMASLRDAADTELANAKASANRQADAIRLNLETLRADSAGFEVLFYDAQDLVLKDNDDLKAVIKSRIADAKQAEQERMDAERERVRTEVPAIPKAKSAPAKHEEPTAGASSDNGRPSDGEIIAAVANAFGVDSATAEAWIRDVI